MKYSSITSCANNAMPELIKLFRGNTCSFPKFFTGNVYVSNEECEGGSVAWGFKAWVSDSVGSNTDSSIGCTFNWNPLQFFIFQFRLLFLEIESDSEMCIKGLH